MSSAAAQLLSERSDIAWVEEVAVGHLAGSQNVPNLANLDRVDQHNAPLDNVYNYPLSGQGVHIYIVDTGIRFTHAEFGNRATVVHDSIGDGNGMDDHCTTISGGHGTHVASIAAGATYGTAKASTLHAVRVADCNGGVTSSHFNDGVNWIAANAVHPAVANISIWFAGGVASVDTAVQSLISSGVEAAVIAGNGNGADACTVSPARVGPAVTVGATGGVDYQAVTALSNQGSCVDVFAPGAIITSACNGSDVCNAAVDGTSFAAPHVAGVLAMYLAGNPTATPATVANQVLANATSNVLTGLTAGSPNTFLYSAYATCVSSTKCGDICANLQTDRNNCGACGVQCDGAQTCVSGACRCPNQTGSCPRGYYWDDWLCQCSQ